MSIKITEKQLKRINNLLTEAPPVDYGDRPERMDPDLESKLGRGEFPGAGNKAFPSGSYATTVVAECIAQ